MQPTQPMPQPMQLTTSRAAALTSGVKCAIYGRSGLGKTLLCATAPNPVIISAERGLLSLRNYDIPVLEVTTFAQMWDAYRFVTESAEGMQFLTVCLDSASEIAEQILGFHKADPTNKDPRNAYGGMQDDMIIAMKAFRDLPNRNVVFTAKQGRHKDEVTGITSYTPDFPGQNLPVIFPYLFDEVFHLGMQKVPGEGGQMIESRVLKTAPDIQYDAKDRSGVLPPLLQVPEMKDGTNTYFLHHLFEMIKAVPTPITQ